MPILMYHLVSPRPVRGFEKYTIAPKAFSAQMNWLVRAGYTSVSLDTLINARCGREALPSRPVIITFDDGYRDCLDFAVPILRDLGLTATIYAVVGLVGAASHWLARERGIEGIPLLGWADALRLKEAGLQCGSHAMTHVRLTEVSPDQCRHELEASRRLLVERLGYEVSHLSFPHGSYNAAVQIAARKAGYKSACSVRIGLSSANDDLFALHRVPVNGGDTLPDFICSLLTARTVGQLLREKGRAILQRPRGMVAPS